MAHHLGGSATNATTDGKKSGTANLMSTMSLILGKLDHLQDKVEYIENELRSEVSTLGRQLELRRSGRKH